jgi:carboxylesterase
VIADASLRHMTEITPGCEPWSCEGGDVGALVLHGATGSPAGVRPLAEALAAEGFAVEMPLYPGHGRTWQEANRTRWHDWVGEVVAAFERLRARTEAQVAVGFSGGGTMSLYLAETRGAELAGLVLINPMIHYTAYNPVMRLVPIVKWFVPSIKIKGLGNDIAKPGQDELAYGRVPLKASASYLPFERTVRRNLHKVTVPTLVFTSRHDHTIHPSDSRRVLDGISSTDIEQVWLERSYHVATLDYDAPLIEQRTAEFVHRVTAPAGGRASV